MGLAGSSVSISSSGNTAITSSNSSALYLGTVVVQQSASPSPSSSQLVISTPNTANVLQTTTGSIYAWGNTTIMTGTTGNIGIANNGNNFGNLTLVTGSGFITLAETATSTYNKVSTSGTFTSTSGGDIITPTNNQAFNVTGNSVLTAANISLTNPTNVLSGTGGAVTFNSTGSTTLVTSQSTLTLGNSSYVGGNLAITNSASGGTIADQASTSGITVIGSTSLIASGLSASSIGNGSIYLTGSNNNLSGGVLTQASLANVQNKNSLFLLPGNADTNAYFTSITGSISTSGAGGSSFGSLTLTAPYGNITISNPLRVSTQLYLNAPLGTANVSFLSKAADLNGVDPVRTSVGTYIPPNP
jgi:hypothetical protein